MTNFFSDFSKVSAEDWKAQIIADLKGKEHSVLEFSDSIEEIEYNAYYHGDDTIHQNEQPGNFPYTRGHYAIDNAWNNGALIRVSDEKEANKQALKVLMQGADLLLFEQVKENCDWNKVLNGVECAYIQTQFSVKSTEDAKQICTIAGPENSDKMKFNFDALFTDLTLINAVTTPTALINGFGVQQAGATTWQEIAFCLNAGHETLLRLMEDGNSIDEAAKKIHFHLGVGSNYFQEIAKFRVMRQLWSKVIDAYQPSSVDTFKCHITAVIGHTNKSLRDPYTNLLRQTTETMSATNGADAVIVLPYDLYNANGTSELAQRMALNISLLLKEESYLDKVIDPVGGSYSIEYLTNAIGQKAWTLFQELEAKGGLHNDACHSQFVADVTNKRAERLSAFEAGKIVGIGMNKYPDPEARNDQWKDIPSYLGLEVMLYDVESLKSVAK